MHGKTTIKIRNGYSLTVGHEGTGSSHRALFLLPREESTRRTRKKTKYSNRWQAGRRKIIFMSFTGASASASGDICAVERK
jgi:hypothetical protein